MSRLLVPKRIYSDIFQLTPEHLRREGVSVVLADLDNTLVRYRDQVATERVIVWKQALERAGIRLFVVSNSRKPTRVSKFCASLGVDYIGHAGKPRKGGFQRALKQVGETPDRAVMIGDQIFTDVWGANRMGIRSWLMQPVALDSIPRRIRFTFEGLFRMRCKDDRRRAK